MQKLKKRLLILPMVLLMVLATVAMPMTVFADGVKQSTDSFTVSVEEAKIGGTAVTEEALASGSLRIENGTSFSYRLAMTPKTEPANFADGDVLSYHVGNVTGLNFPAQSVPESLYIDGVKVGNAVFSYAAATGSIDLRITYNDKIAVYDVGAMSFGQSAQFDLRGTGSSAVTIDLNTVTAGRHEVTVTEPTTPVAPGVYTPTYIPGIAASADKNAPWGVLPKNRYYYEANGEQHAVTVWNIWFGDAINAYESSGGFRMGSDLILTETLDENQKFCTDSGSGNLPVTTVPGAPFGLRLPVHYAGTAANPLRGSLPGSFVWYPTGQEAIYGNGQWGYGTDTAYYQNYM